MANQGTGSLMKIGLLLAAVIIIVRITLELLGAPEWLNAIFGVAWLYFIFPVLFALRIRAVGEANPLLELIKCLLLFGLYTRLMVMVTYMLAYELQWKALRFSVKGGGNVGPDVSALQGLLFIPARNAIIWIVAVIVIGVIIGGVTFLIRKKPSPAA